MSPDAVTGRFVVISDTHFFAPGAGPRQQAYWNRVLATHSSAIAESLAQTVAALAPDFVIHCGDIAGLCSPENWEFACAALDGMGCPWYAVPGNHDTWYPGVRSALSARYGLPPGACHYGRRLLGIQFIFLDLAWWAARDGRIEPYLDRDAYDRGRIAGLAAAPGEDAWLDAELSAARDAELPVVLVGHAPLNFRRAYPIATLPKGRAANGQVSLVDYMGDVVGRKALLGVIRGYPNVRFALAGHWHVSDAISLDGVAWCQTAALREYPLELRLVEVERQRLRVSTVPLLDESVARLSFVPEWNNAWVAGSAEARDFTVELRGKS